MASASVGNPQSLNLFAFVTNDPIDYQDDTGLQAASDGTSYGSDLRMGGFMTPWLGDITSRIVEQLRTSTLEVTIAVTDEVTGRLVEGGLSRFRISFSFPIFSGILTTSGGYYLNNGWGGGEAIAFGGTLLSACLVNVFAPYFANYFDRENYFDIVRGSSFKPGLPPGATLPSKLGLGTKPGAVTVGPYDIYMGSGISSISSPTWTDLRVIAEELSHSEQFIQNWISMNDKIRYSKSGMITSIRRPDYSEAKTNWALKYAAASVAAIARGESAYFGNKYEVGAQDKRNKIYSALKLRFNTHKKVCK